MRLGSALGEAWRNSISSTTRPLAFALALIAAAGGLAVADATTLAGLERQATAFHETGGATYILSADGAISGQACDGLSEIDGIESSGALRTAPGRLEIAALPGAAIPLMETTSDFGTVIGMPDLRAGGLALSPEVATTLGARAGDALALTGGRQATVNGVYEHPDDGRLQALRYAALAPVPSDDAAFDQCWATVWPPMASTKNLLNTALTGDAARGDMTISQFNTSLGAEFDGPALFAARLTAWAPALAALAGLALGALSIRMRRLELASALHARVPRPAMLAQVAVETLLWALPATLASIAATMIAAAALAPDHAYEVLAVALRSIGVATPSAVLGTLLGGLATREKDLFRYFKER